MNRIRKILALSIVATSLTGSVAFAQDHHDDHHDDYHHGGWDDYYHPVATAAAVTATVAVTSAVIGSMVRTVPANCVPVNYGGMIYQQCGTTWYQPQGPQYVVVRAPY